ncbi:uncharacterized protein LOC132941188 [Metopolophium dirhodum]|uniref:uncharacterized protein LOC132941188 n=1 Tax=Metopolophium dirhodum TaxID=44670 RepID=UPI00298FD4C0|nr:uncharacterized protein LOC132941188 [Metopolophium dirhodum]
MDGGENPCRAIKARGKNKCSVLLDIYPLKGHYNRSRGIEHCTINNQTQLIHELELLWNVNVQLLLGVYNAQQRVDRLLSATALGRDQKTSNGIDTDSESTDTDSDNTDTDSDSTDTDSADADACSGHVESGTGQNNAAAKATAEVAVRTIHDLNRRLVALMAATVSAKLVTPLETVIEEDEGIGSEVTCPRRQCRPERPVQQLMKTEPLARNRKFGKLEQQCCMTKVTAEAAVRTIHDLLTLNRRLLALMAATVSDESVSVSAVNKRRWRELRSHIEEYAVDGPKKEKTNEDEDYNNDNDDEFYDASSMESETLSPPPSTPLQTVSKEDEGIASDVTRLQGGQFRPIRSVRQLMKTELWAQHQKYFGKLEQKMFMTQATYAGDPRDRRQTEQVQSAAKVPEAPCTESQTAAASSPLVLPDYSEVEFFFSCSEEDDDDDDYDRREDFAEINCTSSSEKETVDWTDFWSDEEPVRLAAIGAPVASSMRSRRFCRPHHHRQPHPPIIGDSDLATDTMTSTSSTESAAAEDQVDESNVDSVITTRMIVTARRKGTASVGSGSIKRRWGMLPRRCFSGDVDAAEKPTNCPRPPSVADAQVQFGEGNVFVVDLSGGRGDGELQLLQLRRELDAQRRENGRLNDMLLRLQRGMRPSDQGKGDSGPSVPFPDSDPSDLPEPSRLAFGAVHGRIDNLFSPLLSSQPISDDDVDGGDGDRQQNQPDGVEQQMQLLVYDGRADAAVSRESWSEDPLNDDIRRMDHTNLVNVGLPKVVERVRRALVLLQRRSENFASK